ncbi:hypothetical protein [Mycoplana dimorpha]|uniref:Uncharacterized protein n=1 Tax=Mycoplana dimorpha TaxID=28320 RepID=A0A2T5B6A9_MYCDI|nr:hypothetical protein [Mycoplana dimorpha]PTM94464.1 hypothetical protein C7449_105368 [Mycoplana dimorpha]
MSNNFPAKGNSLSTRLNKDAAVVADSIEIGQQVSRFAAAKSMIILRSSPKSFGEGDVKGLVMEIAIGLGHALARTDHLKN